MHYHALFSCFINCHTLNFTVYIKKSFQFKKIKGGGGGGGQVILIETNLVLFLTKSEFFRLQSFRSKTRFAFAVRHEVKVHRPETFFKQNDEW